MLTKNLLVTDRCSQTGLVLLESSKFLKVRKSASPDLSLMHLEDVHGLLIRSSTPITREVLKKAPKLQVIVTSTSGFDHIDLKATQEWGITVMHTPGANVQSAAEMSLALLLSVARKLAQGAKSVKLGEWQRDSLRGFELAGKNLGIVGLGRIGSRFAAMARGLGMRILAFDPYQEDEVFERLEAQRMSYEEILKTADVLSFHVPKTAETFHMLTRSQFEYIHRGIVILNTSRGSAIQENDLAEAIERGWVFGCGLDVFEREPLARSSKLQNLPNVVLSPHLGANTEEALEKSGIEACQKLIAFFQDGSTSDTLPPKAAWYGAQAPFRSVSS